MIKNNILYRKKGKFAPLIKILVTLSLILSSSVIVATQGHPPPINKWRQLIGSSSTINKGFNNSHNIATRGITIYKNELYVGTENHCLSNWKSIFLNWILNQTVLTPQSIVQYILSQPLSMDPVVRSIQNLLQIEQRQGLLNLDPTPLNSTSYDEHYYFSPDGGQHVYYLDPEVFGMSGVPDILLGLAKGMTNGTNVLRVLLHLGALCSDGCDLWKYNSSTGAWTHVVGKNSTTGMGAGFNYQSNFCVGVMKEFKNKLYVGTWNTPGCGPLLDGIFHITRKGCEIWRFDGTNWEQVVGLDAYNRTGRTSNNGGFGNPDNMAAGSIEEYNGYLYVGTMNFNFTQTGACEVWRTNDGENWTKVVDHGFRPNMTIPADPDPDLNNGVTNTYAWEMRNYSGNLYVGTGNSHAPFGILRNGTGCQLWKSSNGITWTKVSLPNGTHPGHRDGFGEWSTDGIRRMGVYNGLLYIGTATNVLAKTQACEVWSYDGTNGPNAWHNLIGEKAYNEHHNNANYSDGFGNTSNKYVWGMTVATDGIWMGAAKGGGCQVFRYNGTGWYVSVRTRDGEISDGFGDTWNSAARSMIEYPKGTGTIIAGTFTAIYNWDKTKHGFGPEVGCEIWKRSP